MTIKLTTENVKSIILTKLFDSLGLAHEHMLNYMSQFNIVFIENYVPRFLLFIISQHVKYNDVASESAKRANSIASSICSFGAPYFSSLFASLRKVRAGVYSSGYGVRIESSKRLERLFPGWEKVTGLFLKSASLCSSDFSLSLFSTGTPGCPIMLASSAIFVSNVSCFPIAILFGSIPISESVSQSELKDFSGSL